MASSSFYTDIYHDEGHLPSLFNFFKKHIEEDIINHITGYEYHKDREDNLEYFIEDSKENDFYHSNFGSYLKEHTYLNHKFAETVSFNILRGKEQEVKDDIKAAYLFIARNFNRDRNKFSEIFLSNVGDSVKEHVLKYYNTLYTADTGLETLRELLSEIDPKYTHWPIDHAFRFISKIFGIDEDFTV